MFFLFFFFFKQKTAYEIVDCDWSSDVCSSDLFALLVSVGGFLSNFLFRAIFKKTKAESAKITLDKHDYLGLLSQMVNFFKYLKAKIGRASCRERV